MLQTFTFPVIASPRVTSVSGSNIIPFNVGVNFDVTLLGNNLSSNDKIMLLPTGQTCSDLTATPSSTTVCVCVCVWGGGGVFLQCVYTVCAV